MALQLSAAQLTANIEQWTGLADTLANEEALGIQTREDACGAERDALSVSADLKEALVAGHLFIVTDFPNSAEYPLGPDDRKVVEQEIIKYDEKAAEYRTECGA